MSTFSVKNFDKFQHYKDRTPPWIRLYNALLDDYEFGRLPDASKAHLIAIWLLASRYENEIPFDSEWVARRINATDPVDLKGLAEGGFIVLDQSCTETLADRKQDAKPEKRRVEERREEDDAPLAGATALTLVSEADDSSKPSRQTYPDAFEALWTEYLPVANKNATKADAFTAWKRLPEAEKAACYSGLIRYVLWFEDERKRDPTTKIKHLATFIHKRGWEPFLEADAA